MLLFLLPVASAWLGWWLAALMARFLFSPVLPRKFFGVTIQGLLPRHQQTLLNAAAGYLADNLVTFQDIENKITDPDSLQRIMPEMEKHIDHFLRVKLKVSMPMIGMLVGERTINQMKEVFLKELEELFPVIMAHYVGIMKDDFDPASIIRRKLATLPAGTLEPVWRAAITPFLTPIKTAGALIGLLAGLLSLLTVYFYHS